MKLFFAFLMMFAAVMSLPAEAPPEVLEISDVRETSAFDESKVYYQNRSVLPGTACRSNWVSDVTIIGDSSQFPGPQQIAVTYHAYEFGNQAYTVTLTVQGGDRAWNLRYDNMVCDVFGLLGNTSGTLIIETQWAAKAYARTSSQGYGALVPESSPISGWGDIILPPFDTDQYRMNLILFNDSPIGDIVTVGPDQIFLPPRETVILMDVAPETIIIPGSGSDEHLVISQVDNSTDDPTNIPFWLLTQ